MINVNYQGQTCYISGHLTQKDVIKLWPDRQRLLNDDLQLVDLAQLEYCDSAGIAFLITLWQEFVQQGRTLQMITPSTQVTNLIQLYNLQSAFIMDKK